MVVNAITSDRVIYQMEDVVRWPSVFSIREVSCVFVGQDTLGMVLVPKDVYQAHLGEEDKVLSFRNQPLEE